MIKDNSRSNLRNLVLENMEADIMQGENNYPKFKGYLKRSSQACYSLLDDATKTSIKCVFNQAALDQHFETLPTYLNFNSFESKRETKTFI